MTKASQLKSRKEMILHNNPPLNQNSVMVACDSSSVHWQIDFVAHDDIPYSSAGSDDVYKHIKEAGKGNFTFLALSFSASAQILLLPFDHDCWERSSRDNITFSYTLAGGGADFSRKVHFVKPQRMSLAEFLPQPPGNHSGLLQKGSIWVFLNNFRVLD